MRNVDRHLGIWLSTSSNGAGVALMAAPMAFPAMPSQLFFYAGLAVFLIGSAVTTALLVRHRAELDERTKRPMLLPVLVMALGACLFAVGAIWLYEKDSLSPKSVKTSSTSDQPVMLDATEGGKITADRLRVTGDTVRIAKASGGGSISMSDFDITGPNSPPFYIEISPSFNTMDNDQIRTKALTMYDELMNLQEKLDHDTIIVSDKFSLRRDTQNKDLVRKQMTEALREISDKKNETMSKYYMYDFLQIIGIVIKRTGKIELNQPNVTDGFERYLKDKSIRMGSTAVSPRFSFNNPRDIANYLEYAVGRLPH